MNWFQLSVAVALASLLLKETVQAQDAGGPTNQRNSPAKELAVANRLSEALNPSQTAANANDTDLKTQLSVAQLLYAEGDLAKAWQIMQGLYEKAPKDAGVLIGIVTIMDCSFARCHPLLGGDSLGAEIRSVPPTFCSLFACSSLQKDHPQVKERFAVLGKRLDSYRRSWKFVQKESTLSLAQAKGKLDAEKRISDNYEKLLVQGALDPATNEKQKLVVEDARFDLEIAENEYEKTMDKFGELNDAYEALRKKFEPAEKTADR
jgi:hypothetical protein